MSDLNPSARDHQATSKKSTASDNAGGLIMDRKVALNRLCGDESLLRDLAKLFLTDAPALLEEAGSALAKRDFATLARSAHSLKGLAANFDAHLVMAAAKELEDLGRHEKLGDAAAIHARLRYELDRLMTVLKDLVHLDEA